MRKTIGRSVLAGFFVFGVFSCDDLTTPTPPANEEVPPPAPSQYNIVGHWEATSSQGRRIAFDVTEDFQVVNGRINLHHDCNEGRWRATFDGYQATIVDDAFITTMNWRSNDNGLVREGRVTVSGRFLSNTVVQGGFIDSVEDVRLAVNNQPTGQVCATAQGSFEGNKQ
jgi:hypothetical protein